MIGFTAAIMAFLMTVSPADTTSDPCGTEGRLVGLANSHGLLVLCAACDVVPGADSVCSAILGDEWKTDFPNDLALRTPRASVASGLDWLCSKVRSLPYDQQYDALYTIESWLEVISAVEGMGYIVGEEAFATAVAFVPAVADLLPRDEKTRAVLGRAIGGSLASGELTGLEYDLARRLSRMPREDQARCLKDLWVEALKEWEE